MRKGICLVLISLLVIFGGTTVYADITIKNDGNERSGDKIYEDSGLPCSFNDVLYYDVAIPYNLTPEDIGGYSSSMPEDCRKIPGGTKVNYENDYKSFDVIGASPSLASYTESCNITWGYDNETDCTTITDKNGTMYYVTAIQEIFYNNSNVGTDGFEGWSSANRGQLFDVILTDGTVIKFIVGDTNSSQHTNGGAGDVGTSDLYTFTELKKSQYKNLFHAEAGNNLEIWGKDTGCVNKFMSKYNLKTDGSGNKIAYYRIYNKKVDSAPQISCPDAKNLSYNLGKANIISQSQANMGVGSGQYVSTGLYKETKFVSWNRMTEAVLEFGNIQELDDKDIGNIENWKGDMEYSNSENILVKLGRTIALWFGIIFLIWIVFIYLFYWFDRINNFIELDLLKIITFGRLTISPDESECTFSLKDIGKSAIKTINHKKLISVCIVGIGFAVFIISGAMFSLLNSFVLWVQSVLT